MDHGTPVATSNISSMPEVGGDAAVYFDPYDVEDIAATIDRVLGDPELRARLAAAGPPRAASFSWERAAELTAQSYERVLAERSA
jgi:alpha-1,3-rhamnosyl/mannosyltransferase